MKVVIVNGDAESRLMKLFGWMQRNAPGMALGAAGVLTGLVLRLPAFPYSLPESTANVIGAGVGAFFAVWAAAWLAERKERHVQLLAVQAIGATLSPLFKRAESIQVGLLEILALHQSGGDRLLRIESVQRAVVVAQEVPLVVDQLRDSIRFMEPLFLQLGGPGVVAHGVLVHTGPAIKQSIERLQWGSFIDDLPALKRAIELHEAESRPVIDQANKAIGLTAKFASGHIAALD